MKRILALALAMLLTAGAVIGVAAYKTDALANKTAVSVRSLYGDPAAADGFTVNYRAAWARRLYWDITVPFGGAAPQAAFTYYKEKAPLEYDFQPSTGLESELDQPGFFADQPANAQKGLSRVLKELYDETPAGEYRTRQVTLKDYYAYYPLRFRLTLPDFGASFNESAVWKRFNDFFRFPVADTDNIELYMDKRNGGGFGSAMLGASWSGYNGGDFFDIATEDAVALSRSRCFLAIRPVKQYGSDQFMDFGEVPGGYGLYSFRYDEEKLSYDPEVDFLAGEIENVLPLSTDAAVVRLTLNADESRLRIFTEEPDGYYMTVLDTDTLLEIQKLRLGVEVMNTYLEGAGVTVLSDGENVAAVTEENGVYTLRFAAPIKPGDEFTPPDLWTAQSACFADGRLAIAGPFNDSRTENGCDTYLLVYDETGLKYCGVCESGPGARAKAYESGVENVEVRSQ